MMQKHCFIIRFQIIGDMCILKSLELNYLTFSIFLSRTGHYFRRYSMKFAFSFTFPIFRTDHRLRGAWIQKVCSSAAMLHPKLKSKLQIFKFRDIYF